MVRGVISLVILIVMLFAAPVFALSIQPSSISLLANSTQVLLFNITNNQNSSVIVKPALYITQIYYPIFRALSANFSQLTLAPYQSKEIKISFSTSSYVITVPNNAVNLSFFVNNKTINIPVYVSVVPPSTGGISIAKLIIPSSVEPNSNVTVRVVIDNTYNYPVIQLPLRIALLSGNVAVLNITKDVTTYAVGENNFNISIPIELLLPKPYTLLVYSSPFNAKLSTTLYVLPLVKIERAVINKISLLGGEYAINFTNVGNTPMFIYYQNVTGPFMLFSTGFFAVVNNTQLTFSNAIPLIPGKSVVVGYYVSFIPLYLVIGVLIISVILVLRSMRYLVISKKLIEHKLSSSGILEARIQLTLKNVSSEELKDITVYDYIPQVSEVKDLGPIESQKIATEQGVKLKWKVGSLAPGEEAIIEYQFRTKTGVFGEMDLGSAEASFIVLGKLTKHKKLIRRSNKLFLEIGV
jgi:hypothetical protein